MLPGEVPYPLGARQTYSLENAELIREFFKELGTDCPNPDALRELFLAAMKIQTSQDHIKVGDLTLSWSALVSLEDRAAVPELSKLKERFEEMGFSYRCGLAEKMGHWAEKGYVPLYVTDLKNWKRHIRCNTAPDQIVLVKPPTLETTQAE
jgi:hypothetical protein